jgi:hypothetical protein
MQDELEMNHEKMLLVGDNPFHGISHLSQERARTRSVEGLSSHDKANVVLTAVQNGAEGFMFSVSDLTLAILRDIRKRRKIGQVKLLAMVPYTFEYVRIAAQKGTPGLAKKFAKQITSSGNIATALRGLNAVVRMSPKRLLNTYLSYEISRIEAAAGKKAISSILLHEVITDMSLALNFDWLIRDFISYLASKNITPGFTSRNLPFLVRKFNDWNIDLDQTFLAIPFNKAGFQMNPSREECEKTLSSISSHVVLAISVLAAGYHRVPEAADYLACLRNLRGVVAGVSTEQQAQETFRIFRERLAT